MRRTVCAFGITWAVTANGLRDRPILAENSVVSGGASIGPSLLPVTPLNRPATGMYALFVHALTDLFGI